AHREVANSGYLLENSVVLAFQEVIEPRVGQFIVVQPRVTHAALADHGVLSRTFVRAVQRRSYHRILLICNLGSRSLSDIVVSSEVRTNRHVIPGHKPESRY